MNQVNEVKEVTCQRTCEFLLALLFRRIYFNQQIPVRTNIRKIYTAQQQQEQRSKKSKN